MRASWVYFMANRPDGVLYVGVTGDLVTRIWQHSEGVTRGFASQYALNRLVCFEEHAAVTAAIQREKTIKHWPRAWKVRLILEGNPDWRDLYPTIL